MFCHILRELNHIYTDLNTMWGSLPPDVGSRPDHMWIIKHLHLASLTGAASWLCVQIQTHVKNRFKPGLNVWSASLYLPDLVLFCTHTDCLCLSDRHKNSWLTVSYTLLEVKDLHSKFYLTSFRVLAWNVSTHDHSTAHFTAMMH